MPWYVSFHCILDAAWVWGCGGWGGWLLVGLSNNLCPQVFQETSDLVF